MTIDYEAQVKTVYPDAYSFCYLGRWTIYIHDDKEMRSISAAAYSDMASDTSAWADAYNTLKNEGKL